MTEFTILIEGYAHPGTEENTYIASPTTILVKSNEKLVLIDPGANRELLDKALKANNLSPSDIDILYLTHYHPDHFLNIRFFPQHVIYDGGMQWDSDKEVIGTMEVIPGTDIKILPTPGHSPEHTSLVIETAAEGTVCLAQDVFWWEDGKQKTDSYEDLMNLVDPFASDIEALKESRKKVLEIADWIVPGHGKGFKNAFKAA